jgi:DegV family protein with EDD domain
VSGITIVTDSVACLTADLIKQYEIEIIPLNILSGNKIYRDWIDITPSQAYELFLKDPDTFKTAPATPEECLNTFLRASKRSTDIICITLSVKISTLFNMARAAIEKAKTIIPDLNINLLDSETATSAQGFVVLAAARAAEANKSVEEVLDIANQVKSRVHTIVLLDTLKHVYRSGRIPKIAAQAASMINIKPIFTVSGTVHFAGAAASKKHGIEHMLKMMHSKVGNQPIHCAVMHAYDLEEAKKLKNIVDSEFNCTELWISEFSPIMGYATGTGTLGIAFYPE